MQDGGAGYEAEDQDKRDHNEIEGDRLYDRGDKKF
jgi:hypothetical protein